jgi:hypothetical protein
MQTSAPSQAGAPPGEAEEGVPEEPTMHVPAPAAPPGVSAAPAAAPPQAAAPTADSPPPAKVQYSTTPLPAHPRKPRAAASAAGAQP